MQLDLKKRKITNGIFDMDSDDEHKLYIQQYKESISQDDKLMLMAHSDRKKENVGR